MESLSANTSDLEAIPLIIAAWLRLLISSGDHGTDDAGRLTKLCPVPRLEELQRILVDIHPNGSAEKETLATTIKSILAGTSIFGTDLNATPLTDKIETFLAAMCQGNGAVENTFHKAASAW